MLNLRDEEPLFTIFPHTADVGIRAEAADVESLFTDAARGLFSLIVSDLDDIQPTETTHLAMDGTEMDYLLFDWLNELLFIFESKRLLLCQFDVSINARGLEAEARGELLDPTRHRMEHEVKAITYHGLRVENTGLGWLAEVIVDI